MKRYAFDSETTQPITQFGSAGVAITHMVQSLAAASVVCVRIEAGGTLGRHPAVNDQLFLVVEGSGEVSGEEGVFVPIEASHAAFWQTGEQHETRSETGLTAVIIEGKDLRLSENLREI